MIKYIGLDIKIHGIAIIDENNRNNAALDLVANELKAATQEIMLRNQHIFNFRNEFESDIEVEIIETAGS